MTTLRTSILSAALLVYLLLSRVAVAQVPAAATTFKGATVGFMHAIHATNNLDVTTAFYKEVFGAASPIRAFPSQMPQVLTNSPGASLRVSMLPLPGQGFNFELTEFTKVERTAGQQPAMSDPGAPHMKILVRDIAPVVAGVKKMGHPIITTSAAPVSIRTAMGEAKAILFRDPDGYIVEAVQVTAPADAPAGNIVGAIMGLTVRDMDADMKFWRDRMGFEPTGDGKFSSDKTMQDLYGIGKGGSFRTMSAVVPGSKARIEFIEFKGMPRKEFSIRVTDPGASGMAIRVQKIQELLPQLKADGIRVLSRNGELVEWSDTIRNVFVKEPNGLNLELVGTPPGVPAVPPPAAQAAPSSAAAAQGAPAGPVSVAVASPTYTSIPLEVAVNRSAADVWKRVGKFCDIGEWLRLPCTIIGGKDGEFGAIRSVANEILVAKTDLSYTYAQPVRNDRPYNMYHGTLEARPVTATTSKLVYTLFFDNSMLADDAAREGDRTRRITQFTQALQNMKILAEGGTLPPAPPRAGGAGAPAPAGGGGRGN